MRLALKMWLSITFAGDGNFSQFDSRVSVLTLIAAVRWSLGKQRRQVTCAQGVPSTLVPQNTKQQQPASQCTVRNLLEAKHWLQSVWATRGDWYGDQPLPLRVSSSYLPMDYETNSGVFGQSSKLSNVNQKVYGYGHRWIKCLYRYC